MDKVVKDLGGHSGCKILLLENEKETFVRKISSDIDYNKRLQIQMQKQENFSDSVIKTPKILDSGFVEGDLFYFDMQYIHGITLAKGIITENIGNIESIVGKIFSMFQVSDVIKNNGQNSKMIFDSKINNLKTKLEPQMNLDLERAFDYLLTFQWEKIPSGSCHGDLTFENIILKNGNIYLIDFLDSFYDSWLLDASTLLQDSFMFWSYKEQKKLDTNLLIKLKVFKSLLEEKIGAVSVEHVRQINALLLLKLLRIYPYVKNENVRLYLNSAVKKMLTVVEE